MLYTLFYLQYENKLLVNTYFPNNLLNSVSYFYGLNPLTATINYRESLQSLATKIRAIPSLISLRAKQRERN
jgi:hypothetical protein